MELGVGVFDPLKRKPRRFYMSLGKTSARGLLVFAEGRSSETEPGIAREPGMGRGYSVSAERCGDKGSWLEVSFKQLFRTQAVNAYSFRANTSEW